jgi:hypothetical protein
MRIGIFGDIHGHWLDFRDAILDLQAKAPLDLVLQVGDAQPISNLQDLAYMPVPERYREPGSYAEVLDPWPVPTLFIGGNHEPWNVLGAMPEGGMLRPGLEYFGRAGLRTIGSVGIAGLSGVYSPRAFDRPRQRWPFLPQQAKDASYYRREDLDRVSRVGSPEILLLHEWPTQLEAARRPDWPKHWETVGIDPLGKLVTSIRPRFVFCGHMHCPAQVQVGRTLVVALDDFSQHPGSAVAVLDGEPGALAMQLP